LVLNSKFLVLVLNTKLLVLVLVLNTKLVVLVLKLQDQDRDLIIIGSLKSMMAEIHHLENRHDVIFSRS